MGLCGHTASAGAPYLLETIYFCYLGLKFVYNMLEEAGPVT